MTEKVLVEGQVLRGTAPQEELVTRKLKQGARHWFNGELRVAGQEIQLTKAQELAFNDKLEPKADAQRGAKVDAPGVENNFDPEDEDYKKATALRPVPTSHIPQDIGAKSITPGLPDVNPGNATRVPLPPQAVNPKDADVPEGQQPPVRDSRTAAIVGGPMTPASLAAESGAAERAKADAGSSSAPSGSPEREKSASEAPKGAPARPPAVPSAGLKK